MNKIKNNTQIVNDKVCFIGHNNIRLIVMISGVFISFFYSNHVFTYAANKNAANQSIIDNNYYKTIQNNINQLIEGDIYPTGKKNIITLKTTKKKLTKNTTHNIHPPDLKENIPTNKKNIKSDWITPVTVDSVVSPQNKRDFLQILKSQNLRNNEKKAERDNIYPLDSEIEIDKILEPNLDLVKAEVKNEDIDINPQEIQLISQVDSSGVVGDTLGETNRLRQELLIDPIIIKRNLKIAPGSGSGTPSAYGASWGQAYIGGGVFFPFDDGRTDGSLSLGFGLGDSVKSIGVEVNVNVTSVGGGNNFDFGDSGTLGFKIHKYFKDGTAVAVGWVDPISWGDSNNTKDTFYGVVTKSFELEPDNAKNNLPLTLSLGVGTGNFRSTGAIDSGENSVNFFGSLSLRVTPQFALTSSWTGNRLNIGTSLVPLRDTPVVINAVITDVTDNFENATGFSLSAGYAFQF